MIFVKLFGQQFARDSLINTLGTILNSGLGLIFFVIIARNLGPANFGLFSVLVAVTVLLADIFDLGVNQGLVKFVSKNLAAKNFVKASQFLKLGIGIKLMVGVIISLAGLVISIPLSGVFKNLDFFPLLLSFFGVLPVLLLGFVFYSLQAFNKFILANLSQIFANILRLVLIVVFLLAGNLSILTAISSFVLSPIFGFLFGFWFLPRSFLIESANFQLFKDLTRFNFWMAGYFVLFSAYWRANTFTLTVISGPAATGIYNVAANLISPFLQLSGNFSTALAPNFTSIGQIVQAKRFFWQTFRFSFLLIVPLVLIIILAPFVVPLLFGASFYQSIIPLQILTLGAAVLIVSVPATTFIVYFLSKPKIYTLLTLVQLFIILAFGIWLISQFGSLGAAIAFLISQFWLFVASIMVVKFKKE